jgi:hypothetical protein
MNANPDTKLRLPDWIPAVLRHAVALLLAVTGAGLMFLSLATAALTSSDALAGFGLLGGAMLVACGGIGLIWSLARGRA